MRDPILPASYETVEAQIRRARLERSIAVAEMFADGADALGRGVNRIVTSILTSFANARDAATIEADVLMKRSRVR
jgi:hypothetical protein